MKHTNMARIGVEHPAQHPKIRAAISATCMLRYGVDHNWKSPELRRALVENRYLKYGIETYFNKSRFKFKTEVIDGVEYTELQGYEGHAIRWLLSRGFQILPRLKPVEYWDSSKRKLRKYIYDLLVLSPNGNVVEVKSTFTAGLNMSKPGKEFRNLRDKGRGVLHTPRPFVLLVFSRKGLLLAGQQGIPSWKKLKQQLRGRL